MEFRFETDYNLETLTAMAEGLRQTVRKKRSRRTRIFAGIILVIGLVSTALSIASKEPLRARNLLVPLAMLCVISASLHVWLYPFQIFHLDLYRNIGSYGCQDL